MGDRANIFVRDGDDPTKDPGVYLYTHWGGHRLPGVARSAVARAEGRWDDPQYLTAIIFRTMIEQLQSGDLRETGGLGISALPGDGEDRIIHIDTATQSIRLISGDKATDPIPLAAYAQQPELAVWPD